MTNNTKALLIEVHVADSLSELNRGITKWVKRIYLPEFEAFIIKDQNSFYFGKESALLPELQRSKRVEVEQEKDVLSLPATGQWILLREFEIAKSLAKRIDQFVDEQEALQQMLKDVYEAV